MHISVTFYAYNTCPDLLLAMAIGFTAFFFVPSISFDVFVWLLVRNVLDAQFDIPRLSWYLISETACSDEFLSSPDNSHSLLMRRLLAAGLEDNPRLQAGSPKTFAGFIAAVGDIGPNLLTKKQFYFASNVVLSARQFCSPASMQYCSYCCRPISHGISGICN